MLDNGGAACSFIFQLQPMCRSSMNDSVNQATYIWLRKEVRLAMMDRGRADAPVRPSTFQLFDFAPSPTSSPIAQPYGFTFNDALSHYGFLDAQSCFEGKSSCRASVPPSRCRRGHPSPTAPEIRRHDTSFHDFSAVVRNEYLTQDIFMKIALWRCGDVRSRLIVNLSLGGLVASEERWGYRSGRDENAPAPV